MESAARLERIWGDQLQSYQFMVAEIPPGLEDLARSGDPVPLGAAEPGDRGRPPVITVYRRPVESAARGLVAVEELVHDVVVEQLAAHMNLEPEAVDPGYGRYRPLQ
ncbi:Possibl zinc metallo-peptidase [Arthrobacter saudimassiliensis]|uniref:Possibl zinc metallo-peptidase n=1 Tax=Arthrobacter saudimassiliensis TaxID=1461584 RepID=A0A078MJC4_9MICC|nr:Possibl zinc metallo-peptidase [Arthrobacter saudimassiliensis]